MDTYLRGAVQALQQDGSDWVAASLALNFDAALNEPHQSIGGFALSEVDQACSRAGLAGSWHGVFACHLRAFASIQQKRFVESYGYHMEMLQHFYEILETETNWLTPAMHVVVRDTRFLSIAADREGLRAGETKDEKIREAERMLKTAFKLCITDRQGPETSKKSGSMYVVTNLFKIYFRLNTLRLCNNLIVTVERPNFPTLDKFPLAHGVTYKFYTGRLSMFNNDFEQAERSLDYALTHCLRSSTRNRRLILLYLIPVKMIMGKFPHPGLLDKYQLDEFKTICTAVRRGELSAFNESLATHQELFVRKGLYLILEKLRIRVYRNLFRAVHIAGGKDQIKLPVLATALRWQGVEMKDAEIECILANLVYKGFIKGYISHSKATLVLSKKCAFPVVKDSC